jgi:hypothetical protein
MKKYRIKQIGNNKYITQIKSWIFWCTLMRDNIDGEATVYSTYDAARQAISEHRAEWFDNKYVYPKYFEV